MRGDRVVVRDFQGNALIRMVWDTYDGVVYVTNEEQFKRLQEGLIALQPIGFPAQDVFKFAPETAKKVKGRVDWKKLIQYFETKTV